METDILIKCVKVWTDNDCAGAARFNDDHLLVFDDKSAALIDKGGTIIKQWWKEEPDGVYWDAYLYRSGHVPSLPLADGTWDLIFNVGHHWPDTCMTAQNAAKELIALLI